MVRPQGDICSLCCTTLMLLFFFSIFGKHSMHSTKNYYNCYSAVRLPVKLRGLRNHIFCLFQITICLAVYCNQGRAGENWGPVPNYKMMPYLLIDRIIVIIINSTYISCNVLISWNTINNHIYEG